MTAAHMRIVPMVGTVALAALIGCASTAPEPEVLEEVPAEAVALTVRVVGAESGGGRVLVAAYGSAASFADRRDPVAVAGLEVTDGVAVWQVPGLSPGRYAVAAYQDLDNDGELDRSAVGIPTEPYGFSNDARGRFGPPSFDAAAVSLDGGLHELSITLR